MCVLILGETNRSKVCCSNSERGFQFVCLFACLLSHGLWWLIWGVQAFRGRFYRWRWGSGRRPQLVLLLCSTCNGALERWILWTLLCQRCVGLVVQQSDIIPLTGHILWVGKHSSKSTLRVGIKKLFKCLYGANREETRFKQRVSILV